jgi:hypothetical protein
MLNINMKERGTRLSDYEKECSQMNRGEQHGGLIEVRGRFVGGAQEFGPSDRDSEAGLGA